MGLTDNRGFWTWRRRIAAGGIAFAVMTFPPAVWLAYANWPVSYAAATRLEVVTLALRCLPWVGAWCFFMFTQTARLFDTRGAEEVLAGLESQRWKRNAKIYQNSVEQAVLLLCTLLPLSAVIDPGQAHILPVLVCFWFFGRVAFFVAYHIEPAYRAFGFDYTLFPALTAGAWFLLS